VVIIEGRTLAAFHRGLHEGNNSNAVTVGRDL